MDAEQGATGQGDLGMGTQGQAHSSLLLARPVLLLRATLGKQGKENNVCQLQNEPIGKECYCQLFSEGMTNKEGENLSLTSGPNSPPRSLVALL